MFSNYESLWKAFIRPTRQTYSEFDLGPTRQQFQDYRYYRQDIELKNREGKIIKCSLFEPWHIKKIIGNELPNSANRFPCIVYCHGNSGCRLDAVPYLDQFIQRGIGLFCFDFYGSGMSEGEYVTLGFKEQNDLADIIKYLRDQPKITALSLFGRSMGAVTTLLYASTDLDFAGLVADSPFSNLKQLALEVADSKISLPNFLLEGLLSFINNSIEERVGFRLDQIDLVKVVGKIDIPAIFVTSAEDRLVKQDHPKKLQSLYKGPSQVKMITGDHNAERNAVYKKQIAEFFEEQFAKYLEKKKAAINKDNNIQPSFENQEGEANKNQQQLYQQQQYRHERSISSNTAGMYQGIIQQVNINTPNIQITQNQNLNTTTSSSSATSSLDNNSFPASTNINIDRSKDAQQKSNANTYNKNNTINAQVKKDTNGIPQYQPTYVQIDLFDKNASNRQSQQQPLQQQPLSNEGNISARGARSHHQKSYSISNVQDGYQNNIKLQETQNANNMKQETNKVKDSELKPQSEAKYIQGSSQSNDQQQQQQNNSNLNVQNYIQNVVFNQQENRYEVSNKYRPLNTQSSSSTSTLNKQTISTNELNTNSNTDLSKFLYINQNDISALYQNTQSSLGNNYANPTTTYNFDNNITLPKETNQQQKPKNDDFSTKLFFKTYDNIKQNRTNKSPTKKLSPKNERREKMEQQMKNNEVIIGGNKMHYHTLGNLDGLDNDLSKASYNKTINTNRNNSNNESAQKLNIPSNNKLEESIRSHQKKVAIHKYQKKRDSTIDIKDQRLSTMQSINDEFQEFELINSIQDLKEDQTPGSKSKIQQNNKNKEYNHYRTQSQQYQIINNSNQKQKNDNSNRNQNVNQININQLNSSSFSKQQPSQQSFSNFLGLGQNQPQYLLKSPRIEEKTDDYNQQNEKEEKIKQSTNEGKLGEQALVELDQDAVKKAQQNQLEEYSQNFGYEKSRVAAYSHNTTLSQNKTVDEININQLNTFTNFQNKIPPAFEGFNQSSTFNEFGMSRKRNIIIEQMNTLLSTQNDQSIINQNDQIIYQKDNEINKLEPNKFENKQNTDNVSNKPNNNYLQSESNKTTNYIPSLSALESVSAIQTENDQIPSNYKIADQSDQNNSIPPTTQQSDQSKAIDESQDKSFMLKGNSSMGQLYFDKIANNYNNQNSANISTQITTSASNANLFTKNNNLPTSSNLPSHHFNLNFIKQQSTESQYNYTFDLPSSITTTNNNNNQNNTSNLNSNIGNTQKDPYKLDFNSFTNEPLSYQKNQNQVVNGIAGTQTLRNSKVEPTVKVPRNYVSLDPSPTGALQNKNPTISKTSYPSDNNKQDEIFEGNESPNTKMQRASRARDSSLPLPSKTNYYSMDFSSGLYALNNNNANINIQSSTNNFQPNSFAQQYSLPSTSLTQIQNQQGQIQPQQTQTVQTSHHVRQQSAHLPPKYSSSKPQESQQGNQTNRQMQSISVHHQYTSSNSSVQSTHSPYPINTSTTTTNQMFVNVPTTQQIVQQQLSSIQQHQAAPPHTSNSVHSNSSSTSNSVSGRGNQNISINTYHQYIQSYKPQSVDLGALQANSPPYLPKSNQLLGQTKNQYFKIKPQNSTAFGELDNQFYEQQNKNNNQNSINTSILPNTESASNLNSMIDNQFYNQTIQTNQNQKTNEQTNQLQKEKYPIIVSNNENYLKKKPTQLDCSDKEQQAYETSSPLNLKRQLNAMAEQLQGKQNLLKLQMNKQINDQFVFIDQPQKQTELIQFKPNSNQMSQQNSDLIISPPKPQVVTKPSEIKQISGNHLTQFDSNQVKMKVNQSQSNTLPNSQAQQTIIMNSYNNQDLKNQQNIYKSGSSQLNNIGTTNVYNTPIINKNPLPPSVSFQSSSYHSKSYSSIDKLGKLPVNQFQATSSINSQEQQVFGKQINSGLPPQPNGNSYSAQNANQLSYTPSYSQKITNYSGNASTADAVSKFKHFTANNSLRNSIENTKVNLNFQYYLPQNQQKSQSGQPNNE